MNDDRGFKIVKLTRGYVTQVDTEDYAKVSRFRWHALVTRSGVYAVGRPYPRLPYGARSNVKAPKVLLHRWLLSVDGDVQHVDHKKPEHTR